MIPGKINRRYILTVTAELDFRQAKHWSMTRWGRELTRQYFTDLHEAAERIAKEQHPLSGKDNLAGETGLGIQAVREHYLVYVPISDKCIVIVALIRQSRDVPEILKANYYLIRRELKEIQGNLSDGNIPNLLK